MSKGEIQELLNEINGGYPGAHLQESDVYFVYVGLLPQSEGEHEQLVKQYTIYDHHHHDGFVRPVVGDRCEIYDGSRCCRTSRRSRTAKVGYEKTA